MQIEFDANKDRSNQLKHGLSLSLVEQIDFSRVIVRTDPRDYGGEIRNIGYGSIDGRLYCFWFTWRGEVCRVIGIRKANPREVAHYG